jgi:DNA-binding response OmpR family regulator
MSDNFVYIVEDDPWYADLLEYYIKLDPEFTVEKYLTGKECLDNLHKNPLAISLDFSLPDLKGGEILGQIRETHPDLPVIVIS